MWMNEYDVEDAFRRWVPLADEFPNLASAAITMTNLVYWTNNNSDGWPYWKKPSRASQKLQDLLTEAEVAFRRSPDVEDISDADYKKALTPIKSFRTKYNAVFTIATPRLTAIVAATPKERTHGS